MALLRPNLQRAALFCVAMVVVAANGNDGHSLLDDDLETILQRRINDVVKLYYDPEQAEQWLSAMTPEGAWVDVDYTAGCEGRRANWPAQDHFHRLLTLSTRWHVDDNGSPNSVIIANISAGLDYWFQRDFTEDDCINAGGRDGYNCPCGTPGMWNTNWFPQMIRIPWLVGWLCLVIHRHDGLSTDQLSACQRIQSRSYSRIDGDPNGSSGPQTGANLLDVSYIGMSLALLNSDKELLLEASTRIWNECDTSLEEAFVDGVKVDGSFMQHNGQIYQGNYGKHFINQMLTVLLETSDVLPPPLSVQTAFLTLLTGSEWLIYRKRNNRELNWQYSTIGRMVSWKYEDWHGIEIELDRVESATASWDNFQEFEVILSRLRSADFGINPGPLIGTRVFWIADMLVHRGRNYITTLKMYSNRTTNSECNNGQNPFGLHLSDGAIYTQKTGEEYTDVFGAWDWSLIPGTTVDYKGVIPSTCSSVQFVGIESFVGTAALEESSAAVAVMNYTNPSSKDFSFSKAFFFFPGWYVVQFVDVPEGAVTVLDQRQPDGPIFIDGVVVPEGFLVSQMAQELSHAGVSYSFQSPVNLTVDTRLKTADWEAIGISKGNETQSLISAYITHNDGFESYMVFLAGDPSDRVLPTKRPQILKQENSTAVARASFYQDQNETVILGVAFFTPGTYLTHHPDIAEITTDVPLALIFEGQRGATEGWRVGVSDPNQSPNSRAHIVIRMTGGMPPIELDVDLGQGHEAGRTFLYDLVHKVSFKY